MALEDLHPNRTIASYILGLLWSDGSIGTYNCSVATVSICQSGERGYEIISWIRDKLSLVNKIHTRYKPGTSPSYRLRTKKYSKILVDLGFSSPKRYRDLPTDFEPGPFLLGLFDGDGTVSSIKHGRKANCIEFCGPELIVQWITIFTKHDDFRNRFGLISAPPRHISGGNWKFGSTTNTYLNHVYNIMYNNCVGVILYDQLKHSKLLDACNHINRSIKLTTGDINEIVQLYTHGESIRTISKRFNVSFCTIQNGLKKAGVEMHSKAKRRKSATAPE